MQRWYDKFDKIIEDELPEERHNEAIQKYIETEMGEEEKRVITLKGKKSVWQVAAERVALVEQGKADELAAQKRERERHLRQPVARAGSAAGRNMPEWEVDSMLEEEDKDSKEFGELVDSDEEDPVQAAEDRARREADLAGLFGHTKADGTLDMDRMMFEMNKMNERRMAQKAERSKEQLANRKRSKFRLPPKVTYMPSDRKLIGVQAKEKADAAAPPKFRHIPGLPCVANPSCVACRSDTFRRTMNEFHVKYWSQLKVTFKELTCHYGWDVARGHAPLAETDVARCSHCSYRAWETVTCLACGRATGAERAGLLAFETLQVHSPYCDPASDNEIRSRQPASLGLKFCGCVVHMKPYLFCSTDCVNRTIFCEAAKENPCVGPTVRVVGDVTLAEYGPIMATRHIEDDATTEADHYGSNANQRQCIKCSAPARKHCSRCKNKEFAYCSVECQRRDWKRHETHCTLKVMYPHGRPVDEQEKAREETRRKWQEKDEEALLGIGEPTKVAFDPVPGKVEEEKEESDCNDDDDDDNNDAPPALVRVPVEVDDFPDVPDETEPWDGVLQTPNARGGGLGPDKLYAWTQTATEVEVRLPVPAEVTKDLIRFKIRRTTVDVRLVGRRQPLLRGTLGGAVKFSDAWWTLESRSRTDDKVFVLTLPKAEAALANDPLARFWSCVVETHPQIDRSMLDMDALMSAMDESQKEAWTRAYEVERARSQRRGQVPPSPQQFMAKASTEASMTPEEREARANRAIREDPRVQAALRDPRIVQFMAESPKDPSQPVDPAWPARASQFLSDPALRDHFEVLMEAGVVNTAIRG
uniref:MYND-type domain-containing protein n=1 Tax=Sexangularia sp. CB-2014 TaxID=1486929 RepID=A0A7S1VPT8_9EUKA|mmetsp:Transcript_7699/g.24697  ORF Transcript_7699/g.24697 Transcript_7699/m.24697 type:complete len:816 (+) Transcript_7699:110-2557(+)